MYKKFVLFLSFTIANAVSVAEKNDWETFKLKHSKSYGSNEEHDLRINIFVQNLKNITEHNELFEKGFVTYELGVNEFSDMTLEEFSANYLGFKSASNDEFENVTQDYFEGSHNFQAKDRVDWREQGAVSNIKQQGSCGSCWSFTTTAVIEGQMKLKHNSLVPLSQQNLIDCNRGGQSGNLGCRGGAMVYAYEYVKRNGGIDDEKSYPYESAKDNDRSPPRKCRYNHKRSAAQVKGYKRIQQGSEPALTEAITTIGPIAVGIDANSFTFMSFKGDGVYYEPRCSSRSLSHAVAVVGYGTDPRFGKYYLIKNSWGRSWGNQGYGKMARGRNNNCGIATDASFPLV